MKTLATVIALVLLTGSVAQTQWKKDGKPVEDMPDRKSVGVFGGQHLVVKNPRAFIEDWQKPETPKINPVSKVQRGEQLSAFVFFAGCKADAQGTCNSEVALPQKSSLRISDRGVTQRGLLRQSIPK